jgi:integrase/recombinase XerD
MDQIIEFLALLENEQEVSESTRKAYASDLQKFVDFLKSNHKREPVISDFSVKAFFQFLDHEKKQGLKPSTLHRRRVSLKKFAAYLHKTGEMDLVSVNAIAGWQRKLWEEIANRESVSLAEAEIQKLLETIGAEQKTRNIRDLLIVTLILETGISIGALVDLNLSDVNLRAKRLRSNNGAEIWYSIEKSVDHLKEYLSESRPELTQSMNEEALFVSQMGGRITRQGVWQVVQGWGEAAGLGVSLSPRILRHTAVRKMLAEGRKVEEIQKLLGHGNKHSTQALIRKLLKTNKSRRKKRK